MHLSIFPREGGGGGGGGGDTLRIRQQNQDSWDGKLDTFSRSSKLNHITNLMAHQRDFGHNVFANGWEISQRLFKIV